MYTIEINCRQVSGYSDDGEWLEGDARELSAHAHAVQVETASEAIDTLRDMETWEPSAWPIGEIARPHEWLSATRTDTPEDYWQQATEVTARLTDGWTDHERAEVFKAVSRA